MSAAANPSNATPPEGADAAVPGGAELERWQAVLAQRAPELIGAFTLPDLRAAFLNAAGYHHLDPRGHATLREFSLPEIIGVGSLDRFHREILTQVQVLGGWSGTLNLRDAWGSEFQSSVTFRKLPETADSGTSGIALYASLPAKVPVSDNVAVTDQEMLHALLETVPERIYFKDAQSRFLRISRSKATKHGLSEPRDIIGKTDFDFYSVEHAAKAFQDEQRILRTGESIVEREEKETYGDGGSTWSSTTKLPFYNREGKLVGTFGISHNITERKQAEERLRKLSAAVEQGAESIVITDPTGRIEYVNPHFERSTGWTAGEVLGRLPALLEPDDQSPQLHQEIWAALSAGREWSGEVLSRRKDGTRFWERANVSVVRGARGEVTDFIAVTDDITAQKLAEAEKRDMESRLQLSQKLESVGLLAAGVAHEINTPTQFISDNTRFLLEAFAQLERVFASHRTLLAEARGTPALASALTAIAEAEAENELDYLVGEIPRTLSQSLEGLNRISKIVGSLKEFSHPGSSEKSLADLNHAIETAIAVSRHEWKYVADVVAELDPALPGVPCVLDEVNQAILNLLINAAHAVGDANKQSGRERGRITVRTRTEPDWAVIEVEDTGTGIPPAVKARLFEPFFTTKEPGKGTGQGLGIVRSVIVKGHGGRVDLRTEVAVGTTFILRLPLARSATAPDSPAPVPATT